MSEDTLPPFDESLELEVQQLVARFRDQLHIDQPLSVEDFIAGRDVSAAAILQLAVEEAAWCAAQGGSVDVADYLERFSELERDSVVAAFDAIGDAASTATFMSPGVETASLPGTATPSPSLVASGLGDRYQVLRKLGEGAMGEVLLANDTTLGRKVAIKVPKCSKSYSVNLYIDEARRVASLDHPNIVPVYDAQQWGDSCYIVSKFVDDSDLLDYDGGRLKRGEPLELERALQIAHDVALGMAHAHNQGVVHRDIKPANILMSKAGAAMVADFGLAIGEDRKVRGEAAGSPAYMSPEQVNCEYADARSDIWSIGVLLFQMLTGKLPFRGTISEIRNQILHANAPNPAVFCDDLPADVQAIVQKCLSPAQVDRFGSAGELATALKQCLHKPQRKPWLWAAAVLLLVLAPLAYLVAKGFAKPQATGVLPEKMQALEVKQDELLQMIESLNLNHSKEPRLPKESREIQEAAERVKSIVLHYIVGEPTAATEKAIDKTRQMKWAPEVEDPGPLPADYQAEQAKIAAANGNRKQIFSALLALTNRLLDDGQVAHAVYYGNLMVEMNKGSVGDFPISAGQLGLALSKADRTLDAVLVLEQGVLSFAKLYEQIARNPDSPIRQSGLATISRLASIVLLRMGNALKQGEYYVEAASVYDDGLRMAREHENQSVLIDLLSNYGSMLSATGKDEEGIAMLQEGLTVSEQVGENPHSLLINLGNAYDRAGNLKEALRQFSNAEAALKADPDNYFAKSTLYHNWIPSLISHGDNVEALKRLHEYRQFAHSDDSLATDVLSLEEPLRKKVEQQ